MNRKDHLPALYRLYEAEMQKAYHRIYVDKSHPAIWFAKELKEKFPDSLFIAIVRNPYAVIASMMKHGGVRWWVEHWKDYPIPNNFLGISFDNLKDYEKMDIVERFAMRYKSHFYELFRLKKY